MLAEVFYFLSSIAANMLSPCQDHQISSV